MDHSPRPPRGNSDAQDVGPRDRVSADRVDDEKVGTGHKHPAPSEPDKRQRKERAHDDTELGDAEAVPSAMSIRVARENPDSCVGPDDERCGRADPLEELQPNRPKAGRVVGRSNHSSLSIPARWRGGEMYRHLSRYSFEAIWSFCPRLARRNRSRCAGMFISAAACDTVRP